MTGEVCVIRTHEAGELRIQFHGIDDRSVMVAGLQYIGATAGTKNKCPLDRQQVVRQCGRQLVEMCECLSVAIVVANNGQALPVGEYTQLCWRLCAGIEAEAGDMPQRDGRTLHNTEQPQRAGVLRNNAAVPDQQGLAQALVG